MNAKPTREQQPLGWMYPMVSPHVEHALSAQKQIVENTALYAQRFFDRRREAVNSSIEAATEMLARPGNAGAAVSAFQKWQAENMERAAEDMSDWTALIKTCTDCLTTEEIAAESEVADMTGKTRGKRKLPTRIPV